MMFPFPYFGMPYYHRYSRYGYQYPPYTYGSTKGASYHSSHPKDKKQEKSVGDCTVHKTNKEDIPSYEDSPLFQLFGINLYFDDILLICLIWFLFEEGVKDEGLFMALVLLLLS